MGVWADLEAAARAADDQLARAGRDLVAASAREADLLAQLRATSAERDAVAGELEVVRAEFSAYRREHPPARRVLWGTSGQNGKSQADYEAYAGKPVGVRREYFGAGDTTKLLTAVKRDLAAGRLPWPTMKFGASWADVAAGADDARLRKLRDLLIALDAEVWIGFHHEPEWDESPAPIDSDSAEVKAEKLAAAKIAHGHWREAQRRAAAIFGEVPSKLRYWLVTTGWGQVAEPNRVAAGLDWQQLYPVGAPVYGIAYDPYKNKRSTDMIRSYVAPLKAEADRRGVQWAIAETGIATEDWELEPDWFAKLHDYVLAQGGLAVAYFDTTLNSARSWTLGAWPNPKAQAFAEVLRRS